MTKIILFLLLPLLIMGQSITAKHRAVLAKIKAAGGGAVCSNTGDLYTQSLEGTGYAANGSWGDESETVSGTSSVDEDYTTTVQCGDQSVYCSVGSSYGKAYVNTTPNASGSVVYYRFYVYLLTDGLSAGGRSIIFQITDGSGRGTRIALGKSGSQLYLEYEFYNWETFSWKSDITTSNVSTGQWYRVEGYFNASGTGEGWEWRVDGTSIASGTNNPHGGYASSTANWYGLDPNGTDTFTLIMDGIDIDSSDWLGE